MCICVCMSLRIYLSYLYYLFFISTTSLSLSLSGQLHEQAGEGIPCMLGVHLGNTLWIKKPSVVS